MSSSPALRRSAVNPRGRGALRSWAGGGPGSIGGVARLGVALCLALLSGCRGTEHFPLQPEPGAAVVAVVLDGELGPVRAVRLDRVDGRTETVELEAEQSLVSFTLPRERFVDEWGEPLGDETWRAWIPLLSPQPDAALGACGRCQIPSDQPPQNVVAGDRCQIPSWAEAPVLVPSDEAMSPTERAALVDAARAQLELAWPGDCECGPSGVPERMEIEVCPVGVPEAMIGPTQFALTDDGTVLATAFGHSLRAHPSGALDSGVIAPTLRDTDQILPTSEGGLLVVVSRSVAFGDRTAKLRYLGPDLRERTVTGLPTQRTSRVALDETYGLVLLGRLSHTPSLVTCAPYSDDESLGLSCTDWLLESSETCPLLHQGAFFRHLLDLGADGKLALSSIGTLARMVPGQNLLACVREAGRSGLLWPLSAELSFLDPSLGATHQLAPDRFLVLVGETSAESPFAGRWAVLLGRLERSQSGGLVDRVRFELVHLGDAGQSADSAFIPLGEGPGLVALHEEGVGGQQLLVFDESGAFVGKEPSLRAAGERTRFREIAAPLLSVVASPSGEWMAAIDQQQNLYRRAPGGQFQPITARPSLFEAPTGLVVELDAESALALSASGAFRVRPGARCGQDELEPLRLEGALPQDLVAAVRAHGEGPEYLVLGQREVARLDLELGVVRPTGVPPAAQPWHMAQALGPGRFVLADRAGALYLLHSDDRLEALGTATEPSPQGLYEIAASGGVLWTGGPDHLGRYRFVAPGRLAGGENLLPQLEAEPWRALDASRRSRPQLDGLAPRCRDAVLLHTNENLDLLVGLEVTADHRYWELYGTPSGYALGPSPAFELEGPAVARLHESSPELRWQSGRPYSVSTAPQDSTVYTFGTSARSLPFPSLSSAAPAGPWIVAAGGRLERLSSKAPDGASVLQRRELRPAQGFRLAKLRAVPRR